MAAGPLCARSRKKAVTPRSAVPPPPDSHRPFAQGVRSLWTRLIAAIRFGPWQIMHSSFCGLEKATLRGS